MKEKTTSRSIPPVLNLVKRSDRLSSKLLQENTFYSQFSPLPSKVTTLGFLATNKQFTPFTMTPDRKHLLPLSVFVPCFVVLSCLCSLVAADCYWLDGSNADDMHECYGTGGADGLCCAEGDLCLLNHLCQKTGTTDWFYRGACYVQDWTQAQTCPQVCDDPSVGEYLNAPHPVAQCDGPPYAMYFCNDSNSGSECWRFSDDVYVFTLPGKVH